MRKHFIFYILLFLLCLWSASDLASLSLPLPPSPTLLASLSLPLLPSPTLLDCIFGHLFLMLCSSMRSFGDHCIAFGKEVLCLCLRVRSSAVLTNCTSIRSFSLVVHLVAVDSLGCDFPFALPLCSNASLL